MNCLARACMRYCDAPLFITIQHEMWLISLETLLMLYGEGSHGHVMEVHQKLRDKFLTPWHSVPADAEIIFVSSPVVARVVHSSHIQ